jgi:hypothetical protein
MTSTIFARYLDNLRARTEGGHVAILPYGNSSEIAKAIRATDDLAIASWGTDEYGAAFIRVRRAA